MSGQTNRESDKFMLRLPEGMRDRIKAKADAANRSMNAEIILALEEWLSGRLSDEADSIREDMKELWAEQDKRLADLKEDQDKRLADLEDQLKRLADKE